MEQFKNLHKGKRCFVIGNGPSLNQLDLSLLKKEITFGCNNIHLMKDFKPKYWCISDWWVADKIWADIRGWGSEITKFSSDRHHNKIMPLFNNCHIIKVLDDIFPDFSDNLAKGFYQGYSVTYFMLQIAYYMGCNPIYLIGIDGFKKGIMNSFFPENREFDWESIKKQTDLSHISFKVAREFLEAKGIKIYNATPDSSVESFKKIGYSEVF